MFDADTTVAVLVERVANVLVQMAIVIVRKGMQVEARGT